MKFQGWPYDMWTCCGTNNKLCPNAKRKQDSTVDHIVIDPNKGSESDDALSQPQNVIAVTIKNPSFVGDEIDVSYSVSGTTQYVSLLGASSVSEKVIGLVLAEGNDKKQRVKSIISQYPKHDEHSFIDSKRLTISSNKKQWNENFKDLPK